LKKIKHLLYNGLVMTKNKKVQDNRILMNIITIGQLDHGKTTLSAAIALFAAKKYGEKSKDYNLSDNSTSHPAGDNKIGVINLEYKTAKRIYTHFDYNANTEYMKNMILSKLDCAILVVSAVDSVKPQTHEHIVLAKKTGISHIIVYLNKIDLLNDLKQAELAEIEIRETLSANGFPGDEIPVIRGSAFNAMNELSEEKENISNEVYENEVYNSIEKLLDAMDNYFPDPVRDTDKPFLMEIEDVFIAPRRGIAVAGKINRGIIKKNEEISIIGFNPTLSDEVAGIDISNKHQDEAKAGDRVGILLKSTNKSELQRGMVLALPGSIAPYYKFKAIIYCLTKEEGGRPSPFTSESRLQFFIRKTDILGTVKLVDQSEWLWPGDHTEITAELSTPIAMEKGLCFDIREDRKAIAHGQILEVIQED